jgi:predicted chitinase
LASKPPGITSADAGSANLAGRIVDGAGKSGPGALEPGIVAGDRDAESIKPDQAKIAHKIEAEHDAVLVDGDVVGKDGKPAKEWIAVEGYDAKKKSFYVREPGAAGTVEWDAKSLAAFAGGKDGGDAVVIEQRPKNHATQREVDALVAAAPSSMRASAETAVPLILDEAVRAGVTDRKQLAYVLATAQHESGLGKSMTERGNGKSADGVDHYFDKYDGMLGNKNPGDGERYKGRGYVQVTGHDNYADWAKKLDLDLVNHPEKLTTPDVAAKALVEGMRDGSFTGKSLGDYTLEKRPGYDYERARAIVNGDRHVVDAATGKTHGALIAGYAKTYEQALLKVEISEELPRLAKQNVNLPEPAGVTDWNGAPRTGTFVKVDEKTYALSVGRGQYVGLDLERDLKGVAPVEGRPQHIDAKGIVTDPPVPQQDRGPAR